MSTVGHNLQVDPVRETVFASVLLPSTPRASVYLRSPVSFWISFLLLSCEVCPSSGSADEAAQRAARYTVARKKDQIRILRREHKSTLGNPTFPFSLLVVLFGTRLLRLRIQDARVPCSPLKLRHYSSSDSLSVAPIQSH